MVEKRKNIFKGRLLNLFKGEKTLPNGRKAYFEEIDHPGASLIVPFTKNKVVFIRQYRAVIGKYLWELPAGILNKGETPVRCAKRETREETGYEIKVIKKIGYIYTSPGFSNELIHVYTAECGERKETGLDYGEVIKVKLLSKKEIKKFFKEGKISDSKTIAALSFAGLL
ncbi:MAG: NUDIX hydrolase [Candidatus Omnitrophota bacterium]